MDNGTAVSQRRKTLGHLVQTILCLYSFRHGYRVVLFCLEFPEGGVACLTSSFVPHLRFHVLEPNLFLINWKLWLSDGKVKICVPDLVQIYKFYLCLPLSFQDEMSSSRFSRGILWKINSHWLVWKNTYPLRFWIWTFAWQLSAGAEEEPGMRLAPLRHMGLADLSWRFRFTSFPSRRTLPASTVVSMTSGNPSSTGNPSRIALPQSDPGSPFMSIS